MKTSLSFLLLLLLSGCTSLRIGYIESSLQVKPLSQPFGHPLIISYPPKLRDTVYIKQRPLPKTRVTDLKKTLSSAFEKTFSGSFSYLTWYNSQSPPEGAVTLIVESVVPSWYEKTRGVEVGCRVSYKISMFKNGAWVQNIQNTATGNYFVTGDLLHLRPGHLEKLIKGGIEAMLEEVYRVVMTEASVSNQSSGTGFLISSRGHILTNSHVVSSASEIWVKGLNGDFSKDVPATLVAEDEESDLALLKVKGLETDSLPFSFRAKGPETGEDVFVLGYPMIQHMGEEVKLTKGIISSRSGYKGSSDSYQISAQVQPGNSGSPVFDNNGYLIGVVNAKIMGAEGVTYVIRPSFISALFDAAGVKLSLSEKSPVSGLSLSEQARILSPFIYIITVEK